MEDKLVHEMRVIETENGYRIEINGDKEKLRQMPFMRMLLEGRGMMGGGRRRHRGRGRRRGGRGRHYGEHRHAQEAETANV